MNQIKINIPQGYEIDEFNKETGDVSFKKIEQKYPQSIFEVKNRDWYISGMATVLENAACDINNVSTKERAEALLALSQLVELRDAWNKIDGFVVDWSNNKEKHCIKIVDNNISIERYYTVQKVLSFGSAETRDLFLKTFSHLIEIAKELL